MKVAYIFELGQGHEFFPRQRNGILNMAVDFQTPLLEWNVWMNAQVKNGKVVNLALTGRKAILGANDARLFASHFAGPTFFARDIIVLHVQTSIEHARAKSTGPEARHPFWVELWFDRFMQPTKVDSPRWLCCRSRDVHHSQVTRL